MVSIVTIVKVALIRVLASVTNLSFITPATGTLEVVNAVLT